MVVYQNRIADCFIEQCRDEPTDNPVYVECRAFFQIPKTMPKWKKVIAETEELPYEKIPDADNLFKNVADALQRIAYTNDARVTDMLIKKRYSLRPRMEVTIYFPMPPLKIAPVVDPEQLSLFEKECE
jgi:Holliday junction resolvase RusA-like endonuclease